jgi:hypothetical protein
MKAAWAAVPSRSRISQEVSAITGTGAASSPRWPRSSELDARLADLSQLTDDERATIAAVIDAITTKAKLRLITGVS